jgi:hypothetical protein
MLIRIQILEDRQGQLTFDNTVLFGAYQLGDRVKDDL